MAGERGQEVRRGLRFRYRKEPCVLKNLQQHNLHPELYFRVGGVRVFLHREETDCQSQQQRTLPALHSSQTPPPPSISQLEEAKLLVKDAVTAGILGDLGSGSNVDLCVITKANVDYLRGYDQPAIPVVK